MKTNVTYIDAAKFETIIVESKLPFSAQRGFVKVQGPSGHAVYVASTKRVGRVDISGFLMWDDSKDAAIPGYVTPHCGPFGNVKQQLDFSLGEDEILSNFRELLLAMSNLAPKAKPERKAPAKKADEPKGWQQVDTKAARKAKIAKHATQA